MVAASKLRSDEDRVVNGMPFAQPVIDFFKRLPVDEGIPKGRPGLLRIVLMVLRPCHHPWSNVRQRSMWGSQLLDHKASSNNGNDSARIAVVEITHQIMEVEANGGTAKYIGVGGKGTAALRRLFADRFEVCMEDVSRTRWIYCAHLRRGQVQKYPWNFAQASAIAERVIRSNPDRLTILSNHFKSVISFDTLESRVVTLKECREMDRVVEGYRPSQLHL